MAQRHTPDLVHDQPRSARLSLLSPTFAPARMAITSAVHRESNRLSTEEMTKPVKAKRWSIIRELFRRHPPLFIHRGIGPSQAKAGATTVEPRKSTSLKRRISRPKPFIASTPQRRPVSGTKDTFTPSRQSTSTRKPNLTLPPLPEVIPEPDSDGEEDHLAPLAETARMALERLEAEAEDNAANGPPTESCPHLALRTPSPSPRPLRASKSMSATAFVPSTPPTRRRRSPTTPTLFPHTRVPGPFGTRYLDAAHSPSSWSEFTQSDDYSTLVDLSPTRDSAAEASTAGLAPRSPSHRRSQYSYRPLSEQSSPTPTPRPAPTPTPTPPVSAMSDTFSAASLYASSASTAGTWPVSPTSPTWPATTVLSASGGRPRTAPSMLERAGSEERFRRAKAVAAVAAVERSMSRDEEDFFAA